jgi:hypothetical protein
MKKELLKMKKVDPIVEGMYQIETLTKGVFVKLSEKSKTVYQVVGYERFNRAYELQKFDDINSQKYLKKGKKVFAGFIF